MVVYFLIRLPLLDQLNLLHDERDISLSGYSIAKTGKDLSGAFLPLSIKNIAPETPFVSIYFSAFWWLFTNVKSVFMARLPFVFISSFLIIIIYQLVKLLTNNKKLAFMTSVVMCFSPWIFHVSRMAFEINIALPLLLIAIIFQIKNNNKISFIFYFLSFYSYQGFRILIPIIILWVFFFFNRGKEGKIRNILPYGIFIILLFSSIFFIDKDITQNRVNQIVFLNTKYFNDKVIFNRNTSTAPSLIKSLVENRITESADYILSSFIKGQDVTYLFKDGDYSALNGSISGGQFLFPLILFYYLGFIAIGRKSDKSTLFILGLIPLGMLPSLLSLNGVSFGIRGIFSSIGYSYIIARGLLLAYETYSKMKNRLVRYSLLFSFLISLFVSLVYFSYTYFSRRSILVGELFNENERAISHYLISQQNHIEQLVFSKNKDNLYRSYLFFNNKKKMFTPQFYECRKLKNMQLPQGIRIISSDCMSDKEYELKKNSQSKKIYFSDISNKIAYFIFE